MRVPGPGDEFDAETDAAEACPFAHAEYACYDAPQRIAQSEAGAASGLFNMMRNLGGAIGTAAVETFFTKREQFHSAIITPQVSLVDPATRDRLTDLQRYFMAHGYPDPAGAMHRAIIAVGQTIRAQATMMGYADAFALIGILLLVAVLAVTMLRKGAAAGGAAH
jgi:DHA2 family multidrug resistance protein